MLGNEVDQKGSLVAAEKLRFDFSHKAQITDKQLEKIEEISTSYIRQNSQVYSKDVPLSSARQINGVRAVFGETYPDPVRVVSVGVPLEDLLQDVQNPAWSKVSIEFCGGTHVDKTGEIKELVVLEESGIAKGTRRIIAVTGQDAYEVQREANEFSERLELLEKSPYSPEKDQTLKQTQIDLNELSISAVTKNRLRDRFAKILKEQLEYQKAAAKAINKKTLDTVTGFFSQPENAEKSFLVTKVPISANAKAITEAIKHISTKMKDKSVYLLVSDEGEGKVPHGCFVSEVRLNMNILLSHSSC